MKTLNANLKNSIVLIRKAMMAIAFLLLGSALFAQSTVVDIVVNSENHTSLEAAVIAAGLADDLSGEGPFTLFAPTDDAFAALPEGTLSSLLENPTGPLADILLYHVVSGKTMSSDLSNGQTIASLNGDKISVRIEEGKAYVDNAMVTVADIKAENGVVHVINAVITPSAAVADAGTASMKTSNQDCGK